MRKAASAVVPLRQSQAVEIAVDRLRDNFEQVTTNLRAVFVSATVLIGNLELDSLEINLEVTADGTVAFLGTGTSLSGTAGITRKFSQRNLKGEGA